ncbi:exodeoxyribonuclease VII large subunit [Porphyromonas sp. COT-290 OH3588]|uniref:exodeoxyribonuclease VII large subunit n=1 Tax=Porphyromonas sp. COT-290 OH3588 TaxID=1515617 RepID=UPI00052E3C22|nr:exodeoxyribonuclease VII large subunit [Porphyromonas sp. COT-290 OH3588]KGO01669.1 exodeoxyribonuclease VII large subunit [Porphyromonas sp. COT-290 OH3588]
MSTTGYSLSQLLGSVRRCLEAGFVGRYWVRAETSDLRRSGAAGHCYLELLEKGERGAVVARVRANIWAGSYEDISKRFARAGLPALSSGVMILALVQVSYHEQFGLSLIIHDIDPSYSLGEIARLRMQTIARLKQDGIFTANKELALPQPLQRLAIISSPSAAGYGDFMNHLRENKYGVVVYTALFPAQMQGEQTTDSVLAALERILEYQDLFDAVVIIRGGGAVSDLRAFDCYELCAVCAQYPLPVIVGIGHERDETVLDLVAHTSQKTPTAVADFVVGRLVEELEEVELLAQRLRQSLSMLSLGRHHWLGAVLGRLPSVAGQALQQAHRQQAELRGRLSDVSRQMLHRHSQTLAQHTRLLPYLSRSYLQMQRLALGQIGQRMASPLKAHQARWIGRLDQYEQALRLAHPDSILKRGFAVIERSGVIVTEASALSEGDRLRIRLGSGTVESIVAKVE